MDSKLGTLERSRGYWRGEIDVPGYGGKPLLLTGSKQAPAPPALEAAHRFTAMYQRSRTSIAAALFDHYGPCVVMRAEVEAIEGSFPDIDSPENVWDHVHPQYVLVQEPRRNPIVEIAICVEWDPEHTLAARLQGDRLVELCASIRRLVP